MDSLTFCTDGKTLYKVGEDDWLAVSQNNEEVVLVNAGFCKGIEFGCKWSDADFNNNLKAQSGQNILEYTNSLADEYYSDIKRAIVPRDVTCRNQRGLGAGNIKDAYMWPMSKEELEAVPMVNDTICRNTGRPIWTRTFAEYSQTGESYRAWGSCIDEKSEKGIFMSIETTEDFCCVLPAFCLRKSSIGRISANNKVVLKL